jgi:hypothetical protein
MEKDIKNNQNNDSKGKVKKLIFYLYIGLPIALFVLLLIYALTM